MPEPPQQLESESEDELPDFLAGHEEPPPFSFFALKYGGLMLLLLGVGVGIVLLLRFLR